MMEEQKRQGRLIGVSFLLFDCEKFLTKRDRMEQYKMYSYF